MTSVRPLLERGRIERLRQWPSGPIPPQRPTVPCAGGPRFRSRTIRTGCAASAGSTSTASRRTSRTPPVWRIACSAFAPRLMRTWWSWVGSASTAPTAGSRCWRISSVEGSEARSKATVSSTRSGSWTGPSTGGHACTSVITDKRPPRPMRLLDTYPGALLSPYGNRQLYCPHAFQRAALQCASVKVGSAVRGSRVQ
jgi:hypothetical protein